MRQDLSDAEGRPIWPLTKSKVSADTAKGIVIVKLRYMVSGGHRGEGACPALALTPLQAVQLAGALQAEVLALKGNVLPFRSGPKS
jgi:hypothetical protein